MGVWNFSGRKSSSPVHSRLNPLARRPLCILAMHHRTAFILATAVATTIASCGGAGSSSTTGSAPAALSYHQQGPDGQPQLVDRAAGMLRVTISSLQAQVTGDVEHWSITPALPEGLSLDALSGAITGAPTSAQARTLHTVTASNQYGSVSTELELSVLRTPRYLYLSSPSDSSISILGYRADTGSLERRGLVALTDAAGNLEGMVLHPSGLFGYSTTTGGQLLLWSVDPLSGWIEQRAHQAIGPAQSHCLALSPDGTQLFIAGQTSAILNTYAIDAGTGAAVATGSAVQLGMMPRALCFDETGGRVFAALTNGNASQVLALARHDDGQVSLLPGAVTLSSSEPADLVFDARNSQLFLSMQDSSSIARLAVAPDGALNLLDSLVVGERIGDLELNALGMDLYASDEAGNRTHRLALQDSGALSAGASLEGGEGTKATWVDPTQRHVLALDSVSHELRVADGSTLSQRSSWNLRSQPTGICVLSGDGPLQTATAAVMATAEMGGAILSYSADPVNGSLTLLSDLQETPGRGCFALEARQRFVYAIDPATNEIEGYTLSNSGGQFIDEISRTPVLGHPTFVTTDASGRFLYCVASDVDVENDGRLNTYAINPVSGALTLINSTGTSFNPVCAEIDPSGSFLFVANNGNDTPGTASIATYQLDGATGLPTSAGSPQVAPGAWALAFRPDGRILYAALRNSDITVSFRINAATGALTLAGPGVRTGSQPIAIAVAPNGENAYVAYRSQVSRGFVAHFNIDESGLIIAPGELYEAGDQPTGLAMDPSGKFLYSANYNSADLSVFEIGPTGELNARLPAPCGMGASFVMILKSFQ